MGEITGISFPVNTLFLEAFYSENIAYAIGSSSSLTKMKMVIIKSVNGGDSWHVVYDMEREFDLFHDDIFCLNEFNCYAVVGMGVILKTIDGGDTWQQENSGTDKRLKSVFCTSDACYAVGDSGVIPKNRYKP